MAKYRQFLSVQLGYTIASQTKPNPNQNGVGFFVRLVCRISRLSSADNYIVTNPLWYSVPVNYRCHPRNMLRTLTNPTTPATSK